MRWVALIHTITMLSCRIAGGRRQVPRRMPLEMGEGMNPGYLSSILIAVSLILFASGWKDVLFRGVSHTRILLFFVGWLACWWWSVPVGTVRVNMTVVLLLAVAAAVTWSMDDDLYRVHVWSAGLLLGSFDLLMRELNGWQLLLQQYGPYLQSTVLLAVVVFLLGRQPLWQFTLVTVGLVSSEFAYLWLHRATAASTVLGQAAFSDHWWLTIGSARLLTVTLELTVRGVGASFKHWSTNRKEWGE